MDMKERVTQHNSVAQCVFLIVLDRSAALWHSGYTDSALVMKIKSMLVLGDILIYYQNDKTLNITSVIL